MNTLGRDDVLNHFHITCSKLGLVGASHSQRKNMYSYEYISSLDGIMLEFYTATFHCPSSSVTNSIYAEILMSGKIHAWKSIMRTLSKDEAIKKIDEVATTVALIGATGSE